VANEYLAKQHTAAEAYALATLSFFAGASPSPYGPHGPMALPLRPSLPPPFHLHT
jgi:hypothetical protein